MSRIIDIAIATAPILIVLGELQHHFALYSRGGVFAREIEQERSPFV